MLGTKLWPVQPGTELLTSWTFLFVEMAVGDYSSPQAEGLVCAVCNPEPTRR